MNEDKTLGERINTIFREQDITIVSTLMAISLAISTISTFNASTTHAGQRRCKGMDTKKQKHISNLLKKLELKALDALLGIIGSILSWLLSTLSKAVGWLAEHVYLFVTGVGMMVL